MTSTTFFLIFIPILAIILLGVNLLFAPHNPYQEKDSVFECGFHSFLGQNRTQFSVSFFIFALLFLLFDLEILLIYPYAVSAHTNGIYGLIIMLVFFIALTLGFVFEVNKNALKIDSRQMFTVKYFFYKLSVLTNPYISYTLAFDFVTTGLEYASSGLNYASIGFECVKGVIEPITSNPNEGMMNNLRRGITVCLQNQEAKDLHTVKSMQFGITNLLNHIEWSKALVNIERTRAVFTSYDYSTMVGSYDTIFSTKNILTSWGHTWSRPYSSSIEFYNIKYYILPSLLFILAPVFINMGNSLTRITKLAVSRLSNIWVFLANLVYKLFLDFWYFLLFILRTILLTNLGLFNNSILATLCLFFKNLIVNICKTFINYILDFLDNNYPKYEWLSDIVLPFDGSRESYYTYSDFFPFYTLKCLMKNPRLLIANPWYNLFNISITILVRNIINNIYLVFINNIFRLFSLFSLFISNPSHNFNSFVRWYLQEHLMLVFYINNCFMTNVYMPYSTFRDYHRVAAYADSEFVVELNLILTEIERAVIIIEGIFSRGFIIVGYGMDGSVSYQVSAEFRIRVGNVRLERLARRTALLFNTRLNPEFFRLHFALRDLDYYLEQQYINHVRLSNVTFAQYQTMVDRVTAVYLDWHNHDVNQYFHLIVHADGRIEYAYFWA